jgi:hypothetical protein
MRKLLLLLTVIIVGALYAATPQWLHIYTTVEDNDYALRVYSARTDTIKAIDHDRSYDSTYDILHVSYPAGSDTIFPLDKVSYCEYGDNANCLYITTDSFVTEIPSKEYYLDATISMSGNSLHDSIPPTYVAVKGRGNTTWSYQKKPYRLKFSKKTALPGVRKGKSYSLIANYLDPTLMRNTFAFKVAKLLGMPYTNNSYPVDVVFNGRYRGSYMLTEKIGFSSNSIDDIDEKQGVLLELDKSMDEKYCFTSPVYKLPVMIKEPDLDEIATEEIPAETFFNKWRNDFENFEATLSTGHDENEYLKYIDISSLVDYLLVYDITYNRELDHPKSVYLYKKSLDDVWHFGPVWDFDWGFGHYDNNTYSKPLIVKSSSLYGAKFLLKIVKTDLFMELFRQRWHEFRNNMLPKAINYILEYTEQLRVSALRNGQLWDSKYIKAEMEQSSETFDYNVVEMIRWIENRADYIDKDPNMGLY